MHVWLGCLSLPNARFSNLVSPLLWSNPLNKLLLLLNLPLVWLGFTPPKKRRATCEHSLCSLARKVCGQEQEYQNMWKHSRLPTLEADRDFLSFIKRKSRAALTGRLVISMKMSVPSQTWFHPYLWQYEKMATKYCLFFLRREISFMLAMSDTVSLLNDA